MAIRDIRTEEKIIYLLKNQGSMSIDDLVSKLYKDEKISERKVKETVLRLREEGKIKPNYKWEMELL